MSKSLRVYDDARALVALELRPAKYWTWFGRAIALAWNAARTEKIRTLP